jgi:uncharacterized MAPEG superfamily protein
VFRSLNLTPTTGEDRRAELSERNAMPVELKMLLFATILLLVLVVVQAAAGVRAIGLAAAAGNREDAPPLTGFAGRAKRNVLNHIENLTVFAPLVLIAVLAHRTGPMTALGAQLFFWGRLVHGVIYLAGLPWIRTIAFAVSSVGIVILIVADLGL